ncbi:MAG: shikimate kinase [Candidatus Omnitrophica bacterium]|nr:shikimate kinase [Candidatus Omnitrophota bacterium]
MEHGSRNIYLIGMMGSGKSVTGRALAGMLDAAFVDFDAEIEKKEGRTIPEIFAQSGEPYFRDVESAVLEDISRKNHQVVATGGGVILRAENVTRMKETGTLVLLEASAKTLWQRLQYSKGRPLLNKPDPLGALTQILSDRELVYKKACHFSVVTDGKGAEDVAREIRNMIKSPR